MENGGLKFYGDKGDAVLRLTTMNAMFTDWMLVVVIMIVKALFE